MPTLKTAQTRPGSLQTSILVPPDLDFAPPDFDFGTTRPRFLNDLALLLSYLATLWHCYLVTLLHCYIVTWLLFYFVLGAVAGSQLCCAVGYNSRFSNPMQWQSLDLKVAMAALLEYHDLLPKRLHTLSCFTFLLRCDISFVRQVGGTRP